MLTRRNSLALGAVAAASLAAFGATSAQGGPGDSDPFAPKGPSTTKNPYVIPIADGVFTKALWTVGDLPAGNGARMVGIPDGLGARPGADGSLEVFMNHELRDTQGVVRRHGQKGAFVSHLKIDRRTFKVKQATDLIDPGTKFWDYSSQTYGAAPSKGGPNTRNPADTFLAQLAQFARFCSGTLSDPGTFKGRRGRGYTGQIYFANEENGNEGRSFGVLEDGTAQQLPRLGLFSWENTIPAHNRGPRTLVMGQEDNAEGQLWAYIGSKTRKGSAFDRAGLTNGVNTVIDTLDESVSTDAQLRAKYGKGKPADVDLSEVDWDQSGAAQNREAMADGLTLNRIEDGHFDPRHPDDFYFLTTEGGSKTPAPGTTSSRDGGGLWKLSFEDINQPELGGTLTLLLDGSEAPYLNKPDNMTIDGKGNLLIQEDPGANPSLARIVAYNIKTGARGVLATFDPALFKPATTNGTDAVITTDEESSGIIDVSKLIGYSNVFLFDAQVHKANPDPELVEEGQLLLLHVRHFGDVYDIK